jgi:hypothetical protein
MKRWMGLGISILIAAACSSSGSDGAAGGGASSPGECPGVDPWPEGTDTCHDNSECPSGCSPIPNGGGCGACNAPQHECEMDVDCGMNAVCNDYPFDEPCNCTGETIERRCQPVCPATACGPDETCDEASGHCNPTPCEDGFTCPTGTTCQMVPWADAHHCRPFDCTEGADCTPNQSCDATPQGNRCITRSCSEDADCACGACVNQHCEGRIGACYTPVP